MVTLIAFHLACFRLVVVGTGERKASAKKSVCECWGGWVGGGGVNCARFVFCLLVLAAVPLSG